MLFSKLLREVDKINEKAFILEQSKIKKIITQIRRSFAIAKKDFRIYYNKGPVVIQGILFPVILFFAFTIGRNIEPIYMISGLMVMVLFLTSTSIGPVVFPWETNNMSHLNQNCLIRQCLGFFDFWSIIFFGSSCIRDNLLIHPSFHRFINCHYRYNCSSFFFFEF